MPSATVTSKGQITIPIQVRKALKLKPGVRVDFYQIENGQFVLRAKTGSIMDMRGCLAGLELPKTDEEMNELIYKRAAELDAATKSDAQAISKGEAA
jgi:AbrB family looped-hinge helix DNA binding protein